MALGESQAAKDPGRKSRRAEIKGVNVMRSALRRAIFMKFRGRADLSDKEEESSQS